ncbi:WXG100 family type VII secretion target [Streptomyces sp. NPDC056656]|uniref:WXG100 family type VII secretion target n=1 Tax=Streptomyces sp. NPDC056656 TaxID=3345895 RepID=UPI0036D0404A
MREHADTIQDCYADINSDLSGPSRYWSGDDANAHAEAWGRHVDAASQAVASMQGMADTLDNHAVKAERIMVLVHEMHEVVPLDLADIAPTRRDRCRPGWPSTS